MTCSETAEPSKFFNFSFGSSVTLFSAIVGRVVIEMLSRIDLLTPLDDLELTAHLYVKECCLQSWLS